MTFLLAQPLNYMFRLAAGSSAAQGGGIPLRDLEVFYASPRAGA